MASDDYRLHPGEPLDVGLRRVAREQVRRAVESLRREEDLHRGIHDARKCLKKVRAVLRLVRDDIGEELFRRENVFYRDLGRELAEARDANAAIETVVGLRSQFGSALAGDAFEGLRDRLVERRERIARRRLVEGGRHERVADRLEGSIGRIEAWPIGPDDFGTIAPGLRRVYKRGRKRFAEAYADPTFERMHEWRKRAKYLWYHLRILGEAWTGVFEALADSAHVITDDLGDANDLSELRLLLEEEPELAGEAEDLILRTLVSGRRGHLLERARPLAERVYHESPDRFVARVRTIWEAWRSEEPAEESFRRRERSAGTPADPPVTDAEVSVATEIERKFLVRGYPPGPGLEVRQGYLAVGEREVRVRIAGDRASITIKAPAGGGSDAAARRDGGDGSGSGRVLARSEVDIPIPADVADLLLAMCPWTLRKTRHRAGRWEVDVFHDLDRELMLAEVELEHPDETPPRPPVWLRVDREVSDDPAYRNQNIARERAGASARVGGASRPG